MLNHIVENDFTTKAAMTIAAGCAGGAPRIALLKTSSFPN